MNQIVVQCGGLCIEFTVDDAESLVLGKIDRIVRFDGHLLCERRQRQQSQQDRQFHDTTLPDCGHCKTGKAIALEGTKRLPSVMPSGADRCSLQCSSSAVVRLPRKSAKALAMAVT